MKLCDTGGDLASCLCGTEAELFIFSSIHKEAEAQDFDVS
jgi:hypothetical protein